MFQKFYQKAKGSVSNDGKDFADSDYEQHPDAVNPEHGQEADVGMEVLKIIVINY